MKTLTLAAVTLLTAGVSAGEAVELGGGDAAPPLSIGKWLDSNPIDLEKASPERVFVFVFWMSWHPECLEIVDSLRENCGYFQGKPVHFVIISDERERRLDLFLREPGNKAKMPYTFAVDDGGKTTRAWRVATGRPPPYAFVVQNRKIQWMGHPTNEDMGAAIAKLLGDSGHARFASQIEAKRTQLRKLAGAVDAAAKKDDWEATLSAVNAYLSADPDHAAYNRAKYHLLVARLKRADEGARWGRQYVAASQDAGALDTFAFYLVDDKSADGRTGMRDFELAKAAAEKAVKLSGRRWPPYLDTLAIVFAKSQDYSSAVQWQTKAVESCEEYLMRREMQARLAEYQRLAATASTDGPRPDKSAE